MRRVSYSLLFCLLLSTLLWAGPIFNVNRATTNANLTGTIEFTAGTDGVFSVAGNTLDWNLTVFSDGVNAVLNPTNSLISGGAQISGNQLNLIAGNTGEFFSVTSFLGDSYTLLTTDGATGTVDEGYLAGGNLVTEQSTLGAGGSINLGTFSSNNENEGAVPGVISSFDIDLAEGLANILKVDLISAEIQALIENRDVIQEQIDSLFGPGGLAELLGLGPEDLAALEEQVNLILDELETLSLELSTTESQVDLLLEQEFSAVLDLVETRDTGTVIVVDGISWRFLDEEFLPGDLGQIELGEFYEEDGKLYIKTGSGLEGTPLEDTVPEPQSLLLFAMGFFLLRYRSRQS